MSKGLQVRHKRGRNFRSQPRENRKSPVQARPAGMPTSVQHAPAIHPMQLGGSSFQDADGRSRYHVCHSQDTLRRRVRKRE